MGILSRHVRVWPPTLHCGSVGLRALDAMDADAWSRLRLENETWLAPWEPTLSLSWWECHQITAFRQMFKALQRSTREGSVVPFAILWQENFAGQLTFANIVRGSMSMTAAGYWVAQHVAGRGVMTTALALGVDFVFTSMGLHRIEVNLRPENVPSRRVVEKLGFRYEGYRERFMHVSGSWRDHLAYAITAEEVPSGGLITRVGKCVQR